MHFSSSLFSSYLVDPLLSKSVEILQRTWHFYGLWLLLRPQFILLIFLSVYFEYIVSRFAWVTLFSSFFICFTFLGYHSFLILCTIHIWNTYNVNFISSFFLLFKKIWQHSVLESTCLCLIKFFTCQTPQKLLYTWSFPLLTNVGILVHVTELWCKILAYFVRFHGSHFLAWMFWL